MLAPFFVALVLACGSARAQVVTEFTAGITGNPYFITSGPCGNSANRCLWFTEPSSHRVGRITTGGTVTEFGAGISSEPYGITEGPCGVGTSKCLWFAEISVLKIGRMDPSTGVVTEFPLDNTFNRFFQITTGPDGNIWFTDDFDGQIGRMKPDGTQTPFNAGAAGAPWSAITTGPDGNLWFSVLDANNDFGRINPNRGAVTGFAGSFPGLPPDRMTTGPDGKLWYVEQDGTGASRIGNLATNGANTPEIFHSTSFLTDIVAGPDGNLWFTDASLAQVGRITTAGSVTDFSVGITDRTWGITAGPDNALWFTEPSGAIGRISTGGSNTLVGNNVALDFRGGAQVPGGVSVTFSGVTGAGNTDLTTSNPCPAVPSGFALGTPPVCDDVTTTASYTPPVQVCISYSGISFGSGPIVLLHYENGAWIEVPTAVDTTNQIVCGSVNSLSPFVVAEKTGGGTSPTTTAIVSSLDPSQVGQPVTFTATVAGNSPGGTIQFMDGKTGHGKSNLGSPLGPPVTLNGGVAQLTTSALTRGTHRISAVYSGDAGNEASTSSVLIQRVKHSKQHGS